LQVTDFRKKSLLMIIAINGVGLATAQGNTTEIIKSQSFRASTELPWTASKSNFSHLCFPAAGIDSELSGVTRWQALARTALAEVAAAAKSPLLVASCNGSAGENWEEAFEAKALLEGTEWADDDLPVFSSSCASGIHALYAARELLKSGAVKEVLVLAADILSRSNHENFESLRVLAERPCTPWQSTSSGFILGEAAVVLGLTQVPDEVALTVLHGPELGSDLVEHDGLSSVIETLSPMNPEMIFGQGTGPYANDAAELRAIGCFVDKNIPISTPLNHFGHTLGASSLLSIALAVALPSLAYSTDTTTDARPICRPEPPWQPQHGLKNTLATCRALNGACAATGVGSVPHGKIQRRKASWKKSVAPGPLMNPVLKRLASEAYEQRPVEPPDVLILRLEKPLAPPPSAIIGGRLLPSAVLEITPGFASQLIARCWGYSGPALCLVGNVDVDAYGIIDAFRASGQNVFQVNLRGSGDNRAIEWNV
jgi:beta-ketoacyl synthase-like protein